MGNEITVGILNAVLRLRDEMSGTLAGVQQKLGSFSDSASKAAKGLATAFAAKEVQEALAGVGEGIANMVENGSHIKDMADRMGVTAEQFQRLSFAAKQGGADMTSVGTAMRMLSTQLADGKLPKVVSDLGISFDDIKRATPYDTLMAAFAAIKQIPDPMQQSAAATALFGRSSQQLLPAIKDGFQQIAAVAPIMRNAVVDSADKIGDKWNEMQTRINALQANAMMPLLDAFTKLPPAVQNVIGVMAMFAPSVGSIGIAILAAGGPVAAFGMLTAAGGAVIAFLTTTLPAAIATAAAFIGPQGLIAVAVLALGAIWYKWGDDITALMKKLWEYVKTVGTGIADEFHSLKDKVTAYVQQLYDGVKHWLIDQFNAVAQGVKDKIAAVQQAFADLYDKVVGHSYVPDMVNEIGRHFARLQDVMVSPTQAATKAMEDAFQGVLTRIGSGLSKWTASVLPKFGNETKGFMGGLMGSLNDLMTGGMNSLINAGLSLAIEGVKKIGSAIAGLFQSEETKKVNKPRDQFIAQFGSYDSLQGALTQALIAAGNTDAGNAADSLMIALNNADTESKFKSAEQGIAQAFAASGQTIQVFHTGGMVQGTGTVPAMLLGGERVLNRAETRAYNEGGGMSLSITIGEISVGTGDSAEVRRAAAMGVLDAIEQGGVAWTKFRILAGQAVPA